MRPVVLSGHASNDLQSGDETALKEDFQSLRGIIHEEGGANDNGIRQHFFAEHDLN